MEDNAVIFVGDKPVMNYVLAVMTQFNKFSSVTLKARGRSISRAVDAAEITRNRFMTNLLVKCITIGTEVIPDDQGKEETLAFSQVIHGCLAYLALSWREC